MEIYTQITVKELLHKIQEHDIQDLYMETKRNYLMVDGCEETVIIKADGNYSLLEIKDIKWFKKVTTRGEC